MAATRDDSLIGAAFPNPQVGQTYEIGGRSVTYGGTDKQQSSEGYEDGSNKKHPKVKFTGKYPNIYVTQGIDGYQVIRSLQPGAESFFEIFTTGSYRSHGPGGEEVRVSMGKKHEYGADGSSQTFDGHVDEKSGGTHRHNVDGSHHGEVAGNKSEAGGGVHIEGSKDSHIQSQTQGDKYLTTEGNVITDHTGHVNHNVTGDFVHQIDGNRFEMVTGDFGINNQGGNFDIQTDTGKTRIFSGGEILVESPVKIVFKVGSSTITMTPSNITLKATRIDLNP